MAASVNVTLGELHTLLTIATWGDVTRWESDTPEHTEKLHALLHRIKDVIDNDDDDWHLVVPA